LSLGVFMRGVESSLVRSLLHVVLVYTNSHYLAAIDSSYCLPRKMNPASLINGKKLDLDQDTMCQVG
jgi:hypothetical protein